MNLAKASVNNSLLVNLISVVILLAGLMTLSGIQREAFPNIAFDVVLIQTVYPGSTPQEVEKLVTIPLEEELHEVEGIERMTSVSVEGRAVITLELDPNESDKRKVVNDIQRAVDRTEDLPEGAQDPIVQELESKDRPIQIVSVTGDDFWQVRKVARTLEELLEEQPGVARVDREDWQNTEIWVEVEPEKLAAYHLSLNEVMRALSARNLNLPGGTMMVGGEQHVIRTLGEFETPEEIEEVIIRANESGNWLRISDVARVRYALEDNKRMDKMNGKRAVNLVVVKEERADTLRVASKVQVFVENFNKELSGGVDVQVQEDLSLSHVRRRLRILSNNLSFGVVFLTLVLIRFLNLRIALITAVAIPLVAMVTFMAMAFAGRSINLLSMFGFIIVLGMLVDDGIVVAENSYRYMERGLPPREAAIRGTSEVIAPVTATILTTVAFFGPLMFMSGIIGKYVAIIPFVVVIALLASLAESFTILPSHIADFAKPKSNNNRERFGREKRWFKQMRRFYMRIVKIALRRRWLVLAGCVVILILTLGMFKAFMRFSLFPSAGAQTFFVRIEAPAGTSLEEMDRRIQPIEAALSAVSDKDLSHFVTKLGIQQRTVGDPHTRRMPKLAQIQAYLTSSRSRKRSAKEIMEQVRRQVGEIPDLDISFETMRTGPPVGRAVEVHIRGEQFQVLEKIAEEYKKVLSEIPGVKDIQDDYEPGQLEFRVLVREEEAKRAKIGVREIANTVRFAYEGGLATTIKRTDEEIDVLVRFPESAQEDPESLKHLLIENPDGKLIPLERVVDIVQGTGLSFIKHMDRRRTVTVTAEVDEKTATSAEVHQKLFKEFSDLSHRYPGYTVRYGGEQEKAQESLAGLGKGFVIALAIQFVILATVFQSLFHPLVVMLAIPFGLVGVIWAFLLHGEMISFMTLLGTVGLSGVVLNDSIILVTFINRSRHAGRSMNRAILSSCFLRFRPVILTTITTVVGLSPVAYGIGGLDPFLKPAALAIVWGLATATMLTLVFIPCVYASVEDIRGWFRLQFRKSPLPASAPLPGSVVSS